MPATCAQPGSPPQTQTHAQPSLEPEPEPSRGDRFQWRHLRVCVLGDSHAGDVWPALGAACTAHAAGSAAGSLAIEPLPLALSVLSLPSASARGLTKNRRGGPRERCMAFLEEEATGAGRRADLGP